MKFPDSHTAWHNVKKYCFRMSSLLSVAAINKALMKMFAGVVVAVVLSCVSGYCFADQILRAHQSAEDWDHIAKIRSQIATDHDLQGNGSGANSFATVGDLLDFYGDEKFLAYENYQTASQDWEKAARAYQSAGDSIKAKEARDNVSRSLEAAKRTLTEGVDLHMRANDQYQAVNNLSKKIQALEKAARNRERLIEMNNLPETESDEVYHLNGRYGGIQPAPPQG
jgi:hypothetical protein